MSRLDDLYGPPMNPEMAWRIVDDPYKWWTVFAWRWGVKVGPLTVEIYDFGGYSVCWLNREIWGRI